MATKGIRIPIMWKSDPRGLTDAEKRMQGFQKAVKGIGIGVAAGFAVIGAAALKVGADAAQALQRLEVIGAQTEAVIKSTGGAANVTADEVRALADRIEEMTATESEAIQEGANLLLTFRNIRNGAGANERVFDRATELMVDMARAMGTDAAGSAIQLGKALNDPIKGVTALTRMGVQFTDEQRDLIRSLVESNDMFGAQQVILDELESQFGGSGEAYASTIAGQIDLLNHRMGALAEEVLIELMPAFETLLKWMNGEGITMLRGFASWFVDEGVPAITGFLDAVAQMAEDGSLVPNIVAGIGAITAAQLALNAAMIANPAGLVIAGLAALAAAGAWVVGNWNTVTRVVAGATRGVITSVMSTATGVVIAVNNVVNAMLRALRPVVGVANQILQLMGLGTISLPSSVNFSSGIQSLSTLLASGLAAAASGGVNALQLPSNLSGFGQQTPAGVPVFADGGVVMPRAGGTLGVIGEAGQAEVVMPLSWLEGQLAGSGGNVYNITVNAGMGADGATLGREIVKAIKQYERASGPVFAGA